MNYRRFTLYFLLVVGLTQCNRPADFLHRIVENQSEPVTFRTKIKEMQGTNKLDVLWVIDNSGSMQTHQQRVIDNTKLFMNAFTTKKLDWKMGLVSTAVGDEPYVGFKPGDELNAKTPDPVGVLQKAVGKLGWNRGCPEVVFQPVMDALTKYPTFSRKRAVLTIIALTDTMEEEAGMQAKFEKMLRTEKGDLARYFKFYGTFSGKSFGCPSWEPPWLYPGSPFEYFVKLTGGKVYELCSPDFGDHLADLGEDIARSVMHSKIALKHRPNVNSLQVAHKGKLLVGGAEDAGGMWFYDFDLNSVVFYNLDFSTDDTDEIDITYEKL